MSQPSADPDQAVLDRAQRFCLTCPRMCRFSCPVAHVEARETVTPWGLMGLLRMVDQGAVPLDAEVAEVLGHCTGCRRCQGACVHQNPVAEAVFEGRRRAADAGLMPGAEVPLPLVLDGESLGFTKTSPVGFWLAMDERPDPMGRARRVAALTKAFGEQVQWVSAENMPSTSGYGWLAGGHVGFLEPHALAFADATKPFDVVLTDSDGLLQMLASPRWQRPWLDAGAVPSRVMHWSVYLAEKLARGEGPAPLNRTALGPVAYHDACKLARSDAPVLTAPRALLRWAFGEGSVRELPDHGADALCCGGGAGYSEQHAEHAAALAAGLLRDAARLEGITRVVSGSPGCAGHLATVAAASGVVVQSLDEALAEAL
jgi:Fe-S oxidoreductase